MIEEKDLHPVIRTMMMQCRDAGCGVAADYILELEQAVESTRRRADSWRGIAAAMGYEPRAHLNVRPTAKWLLDRVAHFRAMAAHEVAVEKLEVPPLTAPWSVAN